MLIVFLPAVEGLRRSGGRPSRPWAGRRGRTGAASASPILWPSFVGATLLLFTNGFSAYATARALVSQGSPLVTLKIDDALSSEVVLGQQEVAKAMALAMVVIVALVMVVYGIVAGAPPRWLQR